MYIFFMRILWLDHNMVSFPEYPCLPLKRINPGNPRVPLGNYFLTNTLERKHQSAPYPL